MEKVLKIYIFLVFFSIVFFSCNDVSKKVDDRIEQVLRKTETLVSLLNQEVDKVLTLDSLIDKEHQKVLRLDSLIQKSSSKLDSVVNKITKPISK